MFGPQGVVGFCTSRELFDFLAQFVSQPMSAPPENFNTQIRRCIQNCFISSGRFDPLLPELVKKGGPVQNLFFWSQHFQGICLLPPVPVLFYYNNNNSLSKQASKQTNKQGSASETENAMPSLIDIPIRSAPSSL
ncbi:hypothetical protein VTN00DRAFT_6457 [Thermoascus crustaceus]|uniref:uncharacterized protein n=1 Tax=Thermoascus crustaceus TaxID=5088 RepID=UPI0037426D47